MKKDGLQRMLDFLGLLRSNDIPFRIERQSPDALMVTFTRSNICIEVDFRIDEMWFSYFGQLEAGAFDASVLRRLVEQNWGN